MTRCIFSFNKKPPEAECWEREVAAASNSEITFVPFNHDRYLDPPLYSDSVQLDRLYQRGDHRLLKLYADLKSCCEATRADAIIVNNFPPYHPDFLRRLPLYKVLYTSDDPD